MGLGRIRWFDQLDLLRQQESEESLEYRNT